MSKTLVIILIIAGMTVGGTAFAAYGPPQVVFSDLISQYIVDGESSEENNDVNDEANVDENGEDEKSETAQAVHTALTAGSEGEGLKPGDEDFGRTVSEKAKAGGSDFGQSVAAAARNSNGADDENDEENGENEKSETAQAVHTALTADSEGEGEGLKPGDEGFGKAVSENAKAGGSDFGQSVAEAARGSNNGSANAGGRGNASKSAGGKP